MTSVSSTPRRALTWATAITSLTVLLTFLVASPGAASTPQPFTCKANDNSCVSYTGFNPNVSTWGQDTNPRGNCTNYVAYRLSQVGATRLNGSGNASTWRSRVIQQFGSGAVNGTPAPGSIAWWSGGAGHVAYVESVQGDTIYLTESSFNIGSARRTLTRGQAGYPEAFLHIKDTSGSPTPNTEADGSLIRLPGGETFRVAGGAPLYLTSCAPFAGCAGVRQVSSLAGYLDRPRDGTVLRASETGRIYKVAGGAPLWLNSCAAGCGGAVEVNQATIDRLDHLNGVPADSTTVRAVETGRIYKFAGGAPLWLNSCEAGCGNPVAINQWTVDTLDHMRPVPSDQTTIRAADTGRIYKIAGGAPLWLNSCEAGCGNPVGVNQWTINTLDHMRAVPSNGATIRAVETGRIYRIAGGTPLWLASCDAGCGAAVSINQWTVDNLDHLRASMPSGQAVRLSRGAKQGWIARSVGGYLFHLSSCAPADIRPACDAAVEIDTGAYDRYMSGRRSPADGARVKLVPSGRYGVFSNGVCRSTSASASATAINDGLIRC